MMRAPALSIPAGFTDLRRAKMGGWRLTMALLLCFLFQLGSAVAQAVPGVAAYMPPTVALPTPSAPDKYPNKDAQVTRQTVAPTTTGGKSKYVRTITAAPSGNVVYLHTDALGSPVARTNAAGQVVSRTRYEPYGRMADGAQPGIGFTGHVNDIETGLTYMQQRYYDPVAGRFLSVDPVLTHVDTGSSFNRYMYANNSPYKYIDPDGRVAFLIPLAPYVATATVAIVGHYVLPGRQGREETVRATGNAILNQGDNAPGTVGSDKGCIYLCDGVSPGQRTPSERPYVGSADDLGARAQGARDGREREGAKVIGEYKKGDRDGRRNAEQIGINEQGGKSELDNKRNEVDQKKWGDRGIEPPEEKLIE